MKRIGALTLAAGLGLVAYAQDPPKRAIPILRPATKADDKKADDQKPAAGSPGEQLAKAKKDYEKAQQAYLTSRREAAELAKEIYEKDPKADVALEAYDVMSATGGLLGVAGTKISAEIAANHYANPKIAKYLATLGRGATGEAFLEKVLAENKDKAAKAQACFMIADAANALVDREKDAKKADELAEKALKYFERAKAEFGDVPQARGGTMASAADAAMFSLKFLRPGKPAPEIEGPDMDEKTFKLSDYKGKVVMLDFWGHW
jgi:tetratricopeptide (TPR) repeat protein